MSSSERERQGMYLLPHARALVKAEASGQAGECRVLPTARVRKRESSAGGAVLAGRACSCRPVSIAIT